MRLEIVQKVSLVVGRGGGCGGVLHIERLLGGAIGRAEGGESFEQQHHAQEGSSQVDQRFDLLHEGDRRRLWGVGWRVGQGGEDAVREAFKVAVGHTKRFGVTAGKVRGEGFFFCLHQICFWG